MFYVPSIFYGDSVLVFALVCITLCPSSFAIILTRKRERLLSSFGYFVTVHVLWLTVPWVGLQFVTVVFPDHTN